MASNSTRMSETLISTTTSLSSFSPLVTSIVESLLNWDETQDPSHTGLYSIFKSTFDLTAEEHLTDFAQVMLVLFAFPDKKIVELSLKFFISVISSSSAIVRVKIVKSCSLHHIIQAICPFNSQLSDHSAIHSLLMSTICRLNWIGSPSDLKTLQDQCPPQSQQEVLDLKLNNISLPSGPYVIFLCRHRLSMHHTELLDSFIDLASGLLLDAPSSTAMLDFVISLPIFLSCMTCLDVYDNDKSRWTFVYNMRYCQPEWAEKGRETMARGGGIIRMLKSEGWMDSLDQLSLIDKHGSFSFQNLESTFHSASFLGMNYVSPNLFTFRMI
ncbi:hypothetical protein BLNAU_3748 [Blattamonas nauphoetae]|uniref:Uncharacterized protein n=1 Tax=Blattamonas nauphoetae TaxID=2049346 RepID=A0ABQ9YC15_9EUKA|nr:hypothetical protein BLNAU_3748 [Blattamonas nauphoetae]